MCRSVSVSVRVCVCVLVTFVSLAKTAERIEMPFAAESGWPIEPCIKSGTDPQREGAIFGGCPPP